MNKKLIPRPVRPVNTKGQITKGIVEFVVMKSVHKNTPFNRATKLIGAALRGYWKENKRILSMLALFDTFSVSETEGYIFQIKKKDLTLLREKKYLVFLAKNEIDNVFTLSIEGVLLAELYRALNNKEFNIWMTQKKLSKIFINKENEKLVLFYLQRI